MKGYFISLIVVFFYTFISIGCFANANIDSLKLEIYDDNISSDQKNEALENLVRYYSNVQLDSASYFGKQLIQNAISAQNDQFLFDAYYVNSYVELLKADYGKCIEFSTIAIQMAKKKGDLKLVSKSYNMLASGYHGMYDYQNAQEYYLKSLRIAEIIQDDKLISAYLNNTAIFYQDIGNLYKAEDYFQKSLELAKHMELPDMTAMAEQSIGHCLIEMNQFELGMEHLENAFGYYQKTHNLQCMAEIENAYGAEYTRLNKFSISQAYLNDAIKNAIHLNNNKLCAASYSLMIPNFLALNQTDSAHYYLKEVWRINSALNDKIGLQNCSLLYYQYYKKTDDYKNALYYNELNILYRDSVLSEELQHKLSQVQLSFDIERQHVLDSLSYVNLREKDVFNRQMKAQKTKFFNRSILVGLIVVFIFSFIYFNQLSKKNKLENQSLLTQVSLLKAEINSNKNEQSVKFNQSVIANKINFKLNDTDWSILNILFQEPTFTNKELSMKVFVSYEGVRSSLKKMYTLFDVERSAKNKKIYLIMKTIELLSD